MKKSAILRLSLALLLGAVSVPMVRSEASEISQAKPLPGEAQMTDPDGFILNFKSAFPIPVYQKSAIFVFNEGKIYHGVIAWRGERLIVLSNPENPASDIPLNPETPTCAFHVEGVSPTLPLILPFLKMMFSGNMSGGHVGFYTANSIDDKTWLSCMTAKAAGDPAKLRVSDLKQALGSSLLSITAAHADL